MDRSRTDHLLEDWAMTTRHVVPPAPAPRPHPGRSLPLALAAAAIAVLVLAGAAVWFSAPRFSGSTVGGSPSHSPSPSPTATATPTPSPSPTPAPSPTATPFAVGTPRPGDAATAAALVNTYISDLTKSDWAAAWALLAPDHKPTLAAFAAERSLFFASVKGRFTVKAPTHDAATLANWLQVPGAAPSANLDRAFIVEVDYPALAATQGSFEIYLAAPDASGHWYVWNLR